MDPGRAALIAGHGSKGYRDRPESRHGSKYRVSKPQASHYSSRSLHGTRTAERPRSSRPNYKENKNSPSETGYLTEEQLSKRFVDGEENFVLRQSKKKADIRVRERRAKPIDLLAFNIRWIDTDRDVFDDEEGDAQINVPSPDAVLASVVSASSSSRASTSVRSEQGDGWQLQELEKDIKSFLTLEKNDKNRSYWEALLVLCKDARDRKKCDESAAGVANESTRVLGSVADDIDRILQPKTLAQLEALEEQIKAKLRRARSARSDDEPIDVDYWNHLLRRLHIWKANACLAAINEAVHMSKQHILQTQPIKGAPNAEREGDSAMEDQHGDKSDNAENHASVLEDTSSTTRDGSLGVNSIGTAAPPPGTARFTLPDSIENEDYSQATRTLYEREVARGMGDNEEVFAAEEEVLTGGGNNGDGTKMVPKWADKYRPRKPRYFNRVQMGYEWNKYNQTHYDHDNPPPKVVQGYKFNVFYPELIDKTKAPTYHITREGGRRKGESFAAAGEEDTCLIRFSAGPPYEDIAFRIVDREWDYSARRDKGFKSVFENGILQLHFQFKKVYYRK